ncbi:MAG TPA: hypothetical protein VHX52_12555 [Steroidobacteraceae bacterium]|jgi:hypothetical protein|nr:hypothetical protein [Steroidobacteraceae bacterium]
MNRFGLMRWGVCAPAVAAAVLMGLGASARHAAAAVARGSSGTPGAGCLPSHEGYLRAHLRGASDLDIDWQDRQMQCDGDVRPGRHGIRLTFAGRAQPGNHRVRFVFGIDAAPAIGTVHNVPASVTVIFEGEGRLYSTRGANACTVDDLQQQPFGAAGAHRVRVSARGFCIGEAGAVGGRNDGLLLSTFDFDGQMTGDGSPAD